MRGHGYSFICAVCFFIHFSVISLAGADTQEFVWKRVSDGIRDSDLKVVRVTPDNPNTVYVSSENVVYKTADGGKKWEEVLSFRGSGNIINTIAINPSSPETVYTGTKEGLYRSNDGGESWEKIFRGVGESENDVLAVAISPENIDRLYIGTRRGLFFSKDNGVNWEKDRHLSANDAVYIITIADTAPYIIYALTNKEIYKSVNSGADWKRHSIPSSKKNKNNYRVNDNNENNSDDTDENEEKEVEARLISIAVDPNNSNILYAGTSERIYVSLDGSVSWDTVRGTGFIRLDIRHIVIDPEEKDTLYIASDEGIYKYDRASERSEKLYKGLTTTDTNFLDIVPTAYNGATLWAVTNKGVFKTEAANQILHSERYGINTENVFGMLDHEPGIGEILEAAIEYANVHPDKVRKWKKAAANRAWLPKLEFEYDNSKDWQVSDYCVSGGCGNDDITEGKGSKWSVSLTWSLGDLIWSDDQTSEIDKRSEAMVELRDDILNEVTRLYFERRRLQYEMVLAPPQGVQEKIEKELRLQELTANIDALTGSYLSKRLKQGSGVGIQKKS